MTNNQTLKLDLKLRYKLIEIVSFWEARLTTQHLCQTFDIGRQQASKVINSYIDDIAPYNLIYDANLKGYRPTSRFKPVFASNNLHEYLQWLTDSSSAKAPFLNLAGQLSHWHSHWIETAIPRTPGIDPKILVPLLKAIQHQQRVEITYVSLNNPKPEPRFISPHTLVDSGNRWHVRAFCEKNNDFRDFVLTRFRDEPEPLGNAAATADKDDYWQHRVKIKIIPDTRLLPAQRKIIAKDYGMTRNQWVIETRAALVNYVLQYFKLDPQKIEAKPEAQQLMIANLQEVEKWYF